MFVFAPILTLFVLIVLFCLMGHFGRAKQFWIVGSTLVFAECAYFKFFHSAVLEYDFVIIGAVFLIFWLLTLLAFILGVQAIGRASDCGWRRADYAFDSLCQYFVLCPTERDLTGLGIRAHE